MQGLPVVSYFVSGVGWSYPANNKESIYKGKPMTLHVRIPVMDPPATGFYRSVFEIDGVAYPTYYTIITGVACIGKRYAAYALLYDLDGMQYEMGCNGDVKDTRVAANDQIAEVVDFLVQENKLESCPQPYSL